MLKKLFILLIAIAPIAAIAQEAKLAYVNSQEIFTAMPELSGIESQFSKKQEEVKKNAEALIAEFNKKAEEFQKSSATASDAVKQDMQKQLQQIEERYQTYQQNSQKELQEMQEKLLSPVHKKIADAIKAVGDEKGFTFIFDVATMQSPIVYVNPSTVNATALVKTKLGIK